MMNQSEVVINPSIGRSEWYAARLQEGGVWHDYFVMRPSEKEPTWSNMCAFGHWKSLEELLYRLKEFGVTRVVINTDRMDAPKELPGIETDF